MADELAGSVAPSQPTATLPAGGGGGSAAGLAGGGAPPPSQLGQAGSQTGSQVGSSAASAAQAAATSELVQRLGLSGADWQGLDDAAVTARIQKTLSDLGNLRTANEKMTPYARLGYKYRQHQPQFEQFLQSGQQSGQQIPSSPAGPRPGAQGQQQDKPWWAEVWNPPQFDQRLLTELVDPATGRIRPEAPPDLVAQAKAWAEYKQQAEEKFWANPHEFIYNSPAMAQFRKDVMQEAVQQAGAMMQRQAVMQHYRTLEQGASEWLYARDDGGQVQIDQMTGNPVLSPMGTLFNLYLQRSIPPGAKDQIEIAQHVIRAWPDAFERLRQDIEIIRLRNGGGQQIADGQQDQGQQIQQSGQTAEEQSLAASNRQFLNAANRAERSPSRSAPVGGAGGAPVFKPGTSLKEKLETAFKRERPTIRIQN